MGKWSKITALLLALCLLIGCNSGPALAVVPDVTETDKDTAVSVLMGQGFVPVVKEFADPTAAIGTVLQTDPPAGSYVAVGGKVYLFVAAKATTTTPPSSTTTAQTSTSATQIPTSLSPPTTTTLPSSTSTATATTTTKPPVATLAIEQTWTVEYQWSLTILSVTAHTLCNPAQNRIENYENQRAITIRYSYENLGLDSAVEPCLFDSSTFVVTDEDGAIVSSYACRHEVKAVPCAIGESHDAEEAYVVDETCRRITLQATLRTSDGRGMQQVRFDIPIP